MIQFTLLELATLVEVVGFISCFGVISREAIVEDRRIDWVIALLTSLLWLPAIISAPVIAHWVRQERRKKYVRSTY